MKEKIYLALVDNDFDMTDEVTAYFDKKRIKILKYHDTLGILKLKCKRELIDEDLTYISHIEPDEVYTISDEEE